MNKSAEILSNYNLVKAVNAAIYDEDVRQDVLLYALENNLTEKNLNFDKLKKQFNKQYFDYKKINFSEFTIKTEGDFINDVLLIDKSDVQEISVNQLAINPLKEKRVFLSYNEAKSQPYLKEIKSKREYRSIAKKNLLPLVLPKDPQVTYRNKGWVSWSDFLGSYFTRYKTSTPLSYKEFEEWFSENLLPLGINSVSKWELFKRNKYEFKIPDYITRSPNHFYKNKGWVSFNRLFNTEGCKRKYNFKKRFIPYKEAAEWVRINVAFYGVDTSEKWYKYRRGDFNELPKLPDNIPQAPSTVYKKTGEWINWGHWLGSRRISSIEKSKLQPKKIKLIKPVLKKIKLRWVRVFLKGKKFYCEVLSETDNFVIKGNVLTVGIKGFPTGKIINIKRKDIIN